jgi:hypothetical protein
MGLALFGVYVAIVGYRGQASRGRRRCPKCWYLIDAALGLKCSECGCEARREKDLYKPRRRWRLALLGLLLIAIGQLGWLEGRVRRGGWLAAVPTEVLIIGMPWLPRECLIDGLRGADEDWSLSGRFQGGARPDPRWRYTRVWSWHRPWAESRAAGLLRDARSSEDVAWWLPCLVEIEDDLLGERYADLLVHAASLSIDGLDDPNDLCAGTNLDLIANCAWIAGPEPRTWEMVPDLAQIASDRRTELLAAATDPASPHAPGATGFLGLGAGEPEVVSALQSMIPGNRAASMALYNLARRHAHVQDAVLAELESPDPLRRLAATRGAYSLMHGARSREATIAVAARLDDADPLVALTAAEMLLWTGPDADHWILAFDGMVEAARADPSLFMRVCNTAGDSGNSLARLEPPVREYLATQARSGDPLRNQLFMAFAIGNMYMLDAELAGEAVRLIDAGVPQAVPASFHQIEQLRAIANPAG